MTDSMLERVARAICTENGSAPDNLQEFGNIWRRQWEAHIVHAKAAIEAMREPTGAVIDVLATQPHSYVHAKHETWRALIDAALNEIDPK
jgi:hypothetical protein